VLFTYHLGRRLFGASAGLWSALALAPSVLFGVAGRAATPDAVLIFCSTLAIYLYARFTFGRSPEENNDGFPNRWWQAALVYGVMGLGVLAKGPVGFVLPTAVMGMFLLVIGLRVAPACRAGPVSAKETWRQMLSPLHFLQSCWRMRPLTAIAVLAAVALPWYLWVHERTQGAWTAGFFLEHNFGRAMQPMEGHRGNLLFYPAALAVGFFPWSVFLAPVLIDTWRELRRGAKASLGYVLALCWMGVYIGVFSLARTKLPSYITPCYPALAVLTGIFVSRMVAGQCDVSRVWLRVAMGVTLLVGAGLLFGVRMAAESLLPGEGQLALIGMLPLAVGLWGAWLVAREQVARLAQLFAGGAVAFSTLVFAVAAPCVDRHQHAPELLAAARALSSEPELAYFRTLEPSWVFYSGRALACVRLPGDADVWEHELSPVEGSWRRQPKRAAGEFLASPDRFVITTQEEWEALKRVAPPGVAVLAEAPYFLKRKQRLVLVGHASLPQQTAIVPESARR
jgi:4-amino-4-deoxy-L-arabinose transferase-like glycosyltransferase